MQPVAVLVHNLKKNEKKTSPIFLYCDTSTSVNHISFGIATSLCLGDAIDSITTIPKMTYRMHLGPSPFDSAPETQPDLKLSFWVNFPFNVLVFKQSCLGYPPPKKKKKKRKKKKKAKIIGLYGQAVIRPGCYTARLLYGQAVIRPGCYTARLLYGQAVIRPGCYTARLLYGQAVIRPGCYTARLLYGQAVYLIMILYMCMSGG